MKIADQCVVAIHYTLTNDRGEQLDSSRDQDPLTYLHGARGIIPGLEQELAGREAGESFQATVPPEHAYGAVDPQLIQEVPLAALSSIDNLQVGMSLQARAADGRVQNLVVDAVGDETATLNANHPLAGEVLHFDVTVESVRAATEEELSLGQVR